MTTSSRNKNTRTLLSYFWPDKPSPLRLATEELEDAQRSLLVTLTASEYAASMSKYHEARIKRLSAFLAALHNENT